MRIKKYFSLLVALRFTFFWKEFKGLEITNPQIWMDNFRKRMLAFRSFPVILMFKEFLNTKIFIIKKLDFKTNKNLIAICVIKNDLEKLKKFLEHHRNLGIKQFAFLDDKSTDGTNEYLREQRDVELFESSEPFFTDRKEAWINRILAYYGFDRWYAVLDSDELLIYDSCEKFNIDKFIALMEKRNITAVSGKMIDMYYHKGIEYFDKTGYFDGKYFRWMPNPTGGMRYRIFEMKMCLGKTPLFILDNKTIYHIHCLFPFEKNFQKRNALGLLHYKFLKGDLEKYKERVNNKSMFNGSEEYKQYIGKIEDEKSDFYDENISEKFVDSQSFVENGLIEKNKCYGVKMPRVSVIIVTYKGFKWYSKCFNSLLASTVQSDIIVVDNNSNDGTVEFIKENFPSIHIIQNNENAGFAKANNQALELAYSNGSNYFFLLNQDAWVETDTIEILLKYASENEQFGILAPVQLNGEKNAFDYAFKKWYLKQIDLRDLCENMFLKKNCLYEVPFVNAAAWLISRKCYEKIGGFDTILFSHYGEDDNYCQRVAFHKFKIGIVFETSFCHDRTAEQIEFNANKVERDYINAAIFYGNINLSFAKIFYKLIRNFAGSILRLELIKYARKIIFLLMNFSKICKSRRANRLKK